MQIWKAALAVGVGVAASAGTTLAGPDWVERGDAGPLLESAQLILGIGELRTIGGSLSTTLGGGRVIPDYEDVYLLRIQVPSTFKFEVMGADFDSQLFLFNVTLPGDAYGLLANDNSPLGPAPLLQSPATDATGARVMLPGVYALGISGVGRVPVSVTGGLFNFASPTEISGPDGPGGFNPLMGWAGEGQTGRYVIRATDVGFYDVPAPGAAGVLLGGLGLLARRRRN